MIQAQAVIFFQSPKLGGHHSNPLEFGSRFHHVFVEVGLFGIWCQGGATGNESWVTPKKRKNGESFGLLSYIIGMIHFPKGAIVTNRIIKNVHHHQ